MAREVSGGIAHLQLELVHPLVALEYGTLHSVHLVMQFDELCLQLLVLDVEAPTLALRELFEVILCLDFLDLGVNEPLCVELLCVHRLQVLLHRDDALLGFRQFSLDDDYGLLVLAQLAVKRAVGLIRKLGKVVEAILELRLLHRAPLLGQGEYLVGNKHQTQPMPRSKGVVRGGSPLLMIPSSNVTSSLHRQRL